MDRLYWETYYDRSNFASFLEDTVNFLHMYTGDIREAIAHGNEAGGQGKVIYNESAWDKEHLSDMQDSILRPNHNEVVKELLVRVKESGTERVDLGFLSRWKNPYQMADSVLPTGITISFERHENGMLLLRGTFFSPDNWFSLQCKPLFKTDPIVERDVKGAWNMNAVGLIAAKPEKVAANRRALFMMLADFSREFDPPFLHSAFSHIYYNPATEVAYLVDPAAKTNDLLLPLVYYFRGNGKILYSDSTDVPESKFGSFLARDRKVYYEKKHFDFLD